MIILKILARTLVKFLRIQSRFSFILRLDAKTLEMFDYTEINLKYRLNNLLDRDILHIAGNFISEAVLEGTLRDLHDEGEDLVKYERKLKIGDDLHQIKPRGPTNYSRILEGSKHTQTASDITVARDQINSKTNLNLTLNRILKLKNFKKPIEDLPESAVMIKKIKRETKEKIVKE